MYPRFKCGEGNSSTLHFQGLLTFFSCCIHVVVVVIIVIIYIIILVIFIFIMIIIIIIIVYDF